MDLFLARELGQLPSWHVLCVSQHLWVVREMDLAKLVQQKMPFSLASHSAQIESWYKFVTVDEVFYCVRNADRF